MINTQLFSYPNVKLRFDKDLIAPNAIPNIEIKQVIWKSLLGKDSKELLSISLLKAQKFVNLVTKTSEDFRKNYMDFRKFPKMRDNDWE